MRQALRESRLDLIDVRRQLEELHTLIGSGRVPPRCLIRAQTPAYRLRNAAPMISVITALYNQGAYVAGALNSVAKSTEVAYEVIVVDDGSTDGSGEVVKSWMAGHPQVQAVLLEHPVNRGLPVARNEAVAAAKGEYVLILDADNEVLPAGLARLRSILEQEQDAWFAYGVLERFDTFGSRTLIGYQGWTPGLLRYGNYIDAMALIRLRRLRQLGGYTTDRRLYGWEDYDLWCRIVEAGGSAAHVANVVGRYRASPTSMLSLSNISLTAAWTALKERCPNVFVTSPTETGSTVEHGLPGVRR
jgi:glycosyltransferase involved in cell wall biosynthesis